VKQAVDCFYGGDNSPIGIQSLAMGGDKCKENFAGDMWNYFTHPFFLFAWALFVGTVLYTHSGAEAKTQKSYGLIKANWYLLNACFIHVLMDGGVGVLSQMPNKPLLGGMKWDLMYHNYRLLDRRFQALDWDHNAKAEGESCNHLATNWVVPTIIGITEILIHTPLCIATYYGYKHGSSWRAPMEILASMIQLVGAIIFIFAEYVVPCSFENLFPYSLTGEGGVASLEAFDNASDSAKFINKSVYLYFGFWLANFVWVVVPTYFIYECIVEIMVDTEAARSTRALVQQAVNHPDTLRAVVEDLVRKEAGDEA